MFILQVLLCLCWAEKFIVRRLHTMFREIRNSTENEPGFLRSHDFPGKRGDAVTPQSLCLVLDGMILLLTWVLEKEVRMLAMVYLVLGFGYEMSPQRAYILKVWSPVSAVNRRLDFER